MMNEFKGTTARTSMMGFSKIFDFQEIGYHPQNEFNLHLKLLCLIRKLWFTGKKEPAQFYYAPPIIKYSRNNTSRIF